MGIAGVGPATNVTPPLPVGSTGPGTASLTTLTPVFFTVTITKNFCPIHTRVGCVVIEAAIVAVSKMATCVVSLAWTATAPPQVKPLAVAEKFTVPLEEKFHVKVTASAGGKTMGPVGVGPLTNVASPPTNIILDAMVGKMPVTGLPPVLVTVRCTVKVWPGHGKIGSTLSCASNTPASCIVATPDVSGPVLNNPPVLAS